MIIRLFCARATFLVDLYTVFKKGERYLKKGYINELVDTIRSTAMHWALARRRRHYRVIVSFPSTEASWHLSDRGTHHADFVQCRKRIK
jgi:hypothetical protein